MPRNILDQDCVREKRVDPKLHSMFAASPILFVPVLFSVLILRMILKRGCFLWNFERMHAQTQAISYSEVFLGK